MPTIYKEGMTIPEGFEVAPSGFLRKVKKPYIQRAYDSNHKWSTENIYQKTIAFNKNKDQEIIEMLKASDNASLLIKEALREYLKNHR